MSKATITKAVAEYLKNNGTPISNAAATSVVESIFSHIAEQLVNAGRFAYPGFGAFRVKAARSGINPLTQKPFKSPETKVVRFAQAKGEENFWSDLAKAKLFKGKPVAAGKPAAKKAAKK